MTADFNNDGNLDLATANNVVLGNGDGTFQPPAPAPFTDLFAQSVAVGDFNADGNLDLATANQDFSAADNDISILLGIGDGTFAPAVYQSIDSNLWSWSIAAGDLNADGRADLVVTSDEPGSFSFDISVSVSVLLSQGDGTFMHTSRRYFVSNESLSLSKPVLADFNSDGITDVAVTLADGGTRSVEVMLGQGNGSLQIPRSFATEWGFDSVAVGDFTGDGISDLVIADGGSGVEVLPGRGDGTFAARIPSASYLGGSITAADFNGDGNLDVVTSLWSSENLSILLGRGDGTFIQSDEPWVGWSITAVTVGDFNGDGRTDVAAADTGLNTVSVLLNDGNWPALPPLPAIPPSVSLLDVTITEGNAGTAVAVFTVILSAPFTQEVTINYATSNGTATSGSDYQAVSGTLTFQPGQTSSDISVNIISDTIFEPNETFVVNLTNADGATITDSQGIGTIINDDSSLPTLRISDLTKNEGQKGTTTFTFIVTLFGPSTKTVTVSYATANGTARTSDGDYTAKSGTLTFKPGETSKTITISVRGDKKVEGHETFFVNLFSANGATIDDGQGVGTILNDDGLVGT